MNIPVPVKHAEANGALRLVDISKSVHGTERAGRRAHESIQDVHVEMVGDQSF
jgi:hypothetical protein